MTDAAAEVPGVIVIGAGAAGLCAAIEASNMAQSVMILDKCPKIGGNSQKASSGINGCDTFLQNERRVTDSCELFLKDTLTAGGGANDEQLVEKLVRESKSAISFLRDANVPLGELTQLGGHSTSRTHRLSTGAPIGFTLVKNLSERVASLGNVDVRTSHSVVSLESRLGEDGTKYVTGVKVIRPCSDGSDDMVEEVISTHAVVVTTGGAAFDRADDGLMAEYAPSLRGMASSSGPQADGHGIRLGRQLGAALVNMDKVQVHPTGMVNPSDPTNISKFLAPEALRGSGGILLDGTGRRFANELGRRGYLTQMISEHGLPHSSPLSSGVTQKVAYLVLDEKAAERFGMPPIGFYASKGLITEYPTATQFAESSGISTEVLRKTLESYCRCGTEVGEDEFGKTVFPTCGYAMDKPVWVATVTPVIHYSLGGMKIDENASVQQAIENTTEFRSIGGLYAAGECTGGVHGYDRLAGNSLLECVVYGRTAGKSAAEYANKHTSKS